jgi:hypothetical protein
VRRGAPDAGFIPVVFLPGIVWGRVRLAGRREACTGPCHKKQGGSSTRQAAHLEPSFALALNVRRLPCDALDVIGMAAVAIDARIRSLTPLNDESRLN